ncbi:hypothetical protein [Streptomyces sp. NPDC000888]
MSQQNGEPEAPPRVYLPQNDDEAPPAYEAYADPAAAHGWQDVHVGDDADTAPLAVVPGDASARHDRLLRRRRTRLLRRAAVAGGAACAVLVVVAVSGLFDSGSSTGPGDRVREATSPAEPATGTTASTDGSAPTAGASSPDPSPDPSDTSASAGDASPSASASASEAPTTGTSSTATATGTPATTADPGQGNGNGNPGQGQGASKRPK